MGLQRCWCYSLRDGSHAIGIFLLALNSLGIINGISLIAVVSNDHYDSLGAVIGFIVYTLFHIGYLVCNVFLVRGVEYNSRGMVLAWLIFHGIFSSLVTVGLMSTIILVCAYKMAFLAGMAVLVGAVAAVLWYWFVVVLSYYQKTSGGFDNMHEDQLLTNI